jgi:trans-aconitate methyltransferase
VPDFEALYLDDPDPWRVTTSWYERRKRAVLLAALPRERYATAWEPACGVGATTLELAERVDDDLLASDPAPSSVRLTAARCRHLRQVRTEESALPAGPATGSRELVVAAEFLYYLPETEPATETLLAALVPGGHLVVQHWRHLPHDAYRSGAEQHAALAEEAGRRGAELLVSHRDPDFLLDVYEVRR